MWRGLCANVRFCAELRPSGRAFAPHLTRALVRAQTEERRMLQSPFRCPCGGATRTRCSPGVGLVPARSLSQFSTVDSRHCAICVLAPRTEWTNQSQTKSPAPFGRHLSGQPRTRHSSSSPTARARR